MATILRKPVPSSRSHRDAFATSYAAAPSDSDTEESNDVSSHFRSSLHIGAMESRDTIAGPLGIEKAPAKQAINDQTSKWGIHWTSPTLMLGLFLLGIASSIAHHMFYNSLNNTEVESAMNQEWAIRIGTGLAFITKASLAAAVGVAYTQRLWLTLRRKSITMQAIDDLFRLTADPASFLSWEALRLGTLLWFMAASMWCIPLIATITPATLAVTSVVTQSTAEVIVPVLDFSPNASLRFFQQSTAGFEEYSGPIASVPLRRLLKTVATGGRALQISPPSINSTFELEFYGPSLKCYDLKAPNPDSGDRAQIEQLRPMFDYSIEDARAAYNNKSSYGIDDKYRANGGELFFFFNRTIPWSIDRSLLHDTLHFRLNGTTYSGVDNDERVEISCKIFNTTYHVLFESTPVSQSTTVIDRKLKEEFHLPRTNYSKEVIFSSGGNSYDLDGGGVQIRPTPSQLAFKAYSDALRLLLSGVIGQNFKNEVSMDSEFTTTSLSYCPEVADFFASSKSGRVEEPYLCRGGSMLLALEDLAQNFTLSMLSSPSFTTNTTTNAVISTLSNRYLYNWSNLIMAYGIGIAVALFGIIIGISSFITNGYSATTSFSQIMLTTRNPDLDRLAEGSCLPALPLEKKLGKVKLRYGLLEGDRKHAAFGYGEHTTELKKGDKCV